jgi:hypothetical protein
MIDNYTKQGKWHFVQITVLFVQCIIGAYIFRFQSTREKKGNIIFVEHWREGEEKLIRLDGHIIKWHLKG